MGGRISILDESSRRKYDSVLAGNERHQIIRFQIIFRIIEGFQNWNASIMKNPHQLLAIHPIFAMFATFGELVLGYIKADYSARKYKKVIM